MPQPSPDAAPVTTATLPAKASVAVPKSAER